MIFIKLNRNWRSVETYTDSYWLNAETIVLLREKPDNIGNNTEITITRMHSKIDVVETVDEIREKIKRAEKEGECN